MANAIPDEPEQQPFKPEEYYMRLKIKEFRGKDEVKKLTFKDLMSNQIRLHHPVAYRQLVDWPALERWPDPNYFNEKAGDHVILAHNYLAVDPFKNFIGPEIMSNQVGRYMTVHEFMDYYHAKFNDEGLKNVLDATNLWY